MEPKDSLYQIDPSKKLAETKKPAQNWPGCGVKVGSSFDFQERTKDLHEPQDFKQNLKERSKSEHEVKYINTTQPLPHPPLSSPKIPEESKTSLQKTISEVKKGNGRLELEQVESEESDCFEIGGGAKEVEGVRGFREKSEEEEIGVEGTKKYSDTLVIASEIITSLVDQIEELCTRKRYYKTQIIKIQEAQRVSRIQHKCKIDALTEKLSGLKVKHQEAIDYHLPIEQEYYKSIVKIANPDKDPELLALKENMKQLEKTYIEQKTALESDINIKSKKESTFAREAERLHRKKDSLEKSISEMSDELLMLNNHKEILTDNLSRLGSQRQALASEFKKREAEISNSDEIQKLEETLKQRKQETDKFEFNSERHLKSLAQEAGKLEVEVKVMRDRTSVLNRSINFEKDSFHESLMFEVSKCEKIYDDFQIERTKLKRLKDIKHQRRSQLERTKLELQSCQFSLMLAQEKLKKFSKFRDTVDYKVYIHDIKKAQRDELAPLELEVAKMQTKVNRLEILDLPEPPIPLLLMRITIGVLLFILVTMLILF
ncbi:unnamed protein product [Moneuplotes crassus]|uniref:Uncharacterized protein n=1 Tax=Euplotes crassus TaxID=5936 RepID=A0AAD1UCB9_EUPCR|nr:unnamed protein product [Moneuplotes crassus]